MRTYADALLFSIGDWRLRPNCPLRLVWAAEVLTDQPLAPLATRAKVASKAVLAAGETKNSTLSPPCCSNMSRVMVVVSGLASVNVPKVSTAPRGAPAVNWLGAEVRPV